MYIKKITYTDYDGNERTEEFLFSLNKAEIIKWLMTNGDYTLDKVLDRMAKERDGKKMIETFEDLIAKSIGKKSLDGRRIEKSPEITKDFMETEAYSNLFMELITDAKAASDFINKIMPASLVDDVNKFMKEHPDQIPIDDKGQLIELNK